MRYRVCVLEVCVYVLQIYLTIIDNLDDPQVSSINGRSGRCVVLMKFEVKLNSVGL